jgi:2-polyprenyl-3-methyl-5-hydroxy-6-metoxy-1,4-benzoquinol methylase
MIPAPGMNTATAPLSVAWDGEYKESQIAESPRYAVIADIVNRFAEKHDRAIKVIDGGCGEGYLLRFLDRSKIRYIGVDMDEPALSSVPLNPGDSVHMAPIDDFWDFRPGAPVGIDVIVLNEVLYYLDDPVACMNRYMPIVENGGLMVISIHLKPLRDELKSRLGSLRSGIARTTNNQTWTMVRENFGHRFKGQWEINNGRKRWMVVSV